MSHAHPKVKVAFNANDDPQQATLRKAMHSLYCGGCPDVIHYSDISSRDNALAPQCDVFVSGAACPAWPWAHRRVDVGPDGAVDTRRLPILASLGYVWHQRPRLAIFDNVDTLVYTRRAHVLSVIQNILKMRGYRVNMAVVDTQHHGIPHSRDRLCIVAVRLDAEVVPFEFPNPINNAPALRHFLSRSSPKQPYMRIVPGGLAIKISHIGSPLINGCEFLTRWFVLDPLSNPRARKLIMGGMVPCATAAKLMGLFLTVYDIGALQGLPANAVAAMLAALDNDRTTLGNLLSDAMSINVIMRILSTALFSAGLVATPVLDHWASAPAIVAGASSALKLPEALYTSIGR